MADLEVIMLLWGPVSLFQPPVHNHEKDDEDGDDADADADADADDAADAADADASVWCVFEGGEQ